MLESLAPSVRTRDAKTTTRQADNSSYRMDPRLLVHILYGASRTKNIGRTHPLVLLSHPYSENQYSWWYNSKLANCPWLRMSARAKLPFLTVRYRPDRGWVVGDATQCWGGSQTTKKPRGLLKGQPRSRASPTGRIVMLDEISSCLEVSLSLSRVEQRPSCAECRFSSAMGLPKARSKSNSAGL